MRADILPAILAKTETEFREKLRMIEGVAPLVHLDVMDGKFVPSTTWADPKVVTTMQTPVKFEVHLMVEEPFRDALAWGEVPSVARIVVHAESTKLLRELLHVVRVTDKEVGLAMSPGTKIADLRSQISDSIDFLLLMANEPGFA